MRFTKIFFFLALIALVLSQGGRGGGGGNGNRGGNSGRGRQGNGNGQGHPQNNNGNPPPYNQNPQPQTPPNSQPSPNSSQDSSTNSQNQNTGTQTTGTHTGGSNTGSQNTGTSTQGSQNSGTLSNQNGKNQQPQNTQGPSSNSQNPIRMNFNRSDDSDSNSFPIWTVVGVSLGVALALITLRIFYRYYQNKKIVRIRGQRGMVVNGRIIPPSDEIPVFNRGRIIITVPLIVVPDLGSNNGTGRIGNNEINTNFVKINPTQVQVKSKDILDDSQSESQKGEALCVICFGDAPNAMLSPCNHANFCLKCTKAFAQRTGSCPLCRAKIERVVEFKKDSIA